MALQRFVESYIPKASDTFKPERRKITESEVSKISASHLTESTKLYLERTGVADLKEKTVWKLPISRYDWENANGRVYEKKLWDRVIQEQCDAYQGNIGLADHPGAEDDAAFKESAIVWLNMGLNESDKTVYGEGIFVGPFGKLAEEIMEAGGRVGFSSSGFGELDESRIVEGKPKYVRWDTYQLERPADIVLNPSQGVYGRSGMQIKNEMVSSNGITKFCPHCGEQNISCIDGKCPKCGKDIKTADYNDLVRNHLKNRNTVNESTENNLMEKVMKADSSNSKLSKYEERKFNQDVESYFTEAATIVDPSERYAELTELLSYFDEANESDLKKKIVEAAGKAKSEIDAAIVEHTELVKDFGISTTKELKESVKTLAENTQYFERNADEWKKIAEGLQDKCQKLMAILETRPTVEAYKTATDFNVQLKSIFAEKENKLLGEIKAREDSIAKMQGINDKLVEEIKTRDTVITELKDREIAYRKLIETANSTISKFREKEMAEKAAIEEKIRKQDEIKLRPEGSIKTRFNGFSESSEVADYYEDLVNRYGESIVPYKDHILGKKTLREAMTTFNKIFASMDSSKYTKITEALDPEDRQKLIESQTGLKVAATRKFNKRMPETWE